MKDKISDVSLKFTESDYSEYFLGTGSTLLNKICNDSDDSKVQKSCTILQKLFVDKIFRNYKKKINNTYHYFLNKTENAIPEVIIKKNIKDVINENIDIISGPFCDYIEEKENLYYIYDSMSKKKDFYIDTNFFGIKKYQKLCENKSDDYFCRTLSNYMTILFSKFIKGDLHTEIINDKKNNRDTWYITSRMYHLLKSGKDYSENINSIKSDLNFIEKVLNNEVFNKDDIFKEEH